MFIVVSVVTNGTREIRAICDTKEAAMTIIGKLMTGDTNFNSLLVVESEVNTMFTMPANSDALYEITCRAAKDTAVVPKPAVVKPSKDESEDEDEDEDDDEDDDGDESESSKKISVHGKSDKKDDKKSSHTHESKKDDKKSIVSKDKKDDKKSSSSKKDDKKSSSKHENNKKDDKKSKLLKCCRIKEKDKNK